MNYHIHVNGTPFAKHIETKAQRFTAWLANQSTVESALLAQIHEPHDLLTASSNGGSPEVSYHITIMGHKDFDNPEDATAFEEEIAQKAKEFVESLGDSVNNASMSGNTANYQLYTPEAPQE